MTKRYFYSHLIEKKIHQINKLNRNKIKETANIKPRKAFIKKIISH